LYYKKTEGEIESAKAKLFARQRAVAVELGPRFDPLRDRLEGWAVASAAPYPGDLVSPELSRWDFAALPGIYLRLRLVDVTSVPRLRKAANESLRDAFTACLFHEPNHDPTSGATCRTTHECQAGTFCNEMSHCVPPAQPYNLRAAYRGTRILSDDWSIGLRAADSDMKIRLLEREFDAAVNDDVPLVIDLMSRAQFFLLVLDEDPEGGMPPDAGPVTTESVQALPHPARVALWNLKRNDDQPLLRLRRTVDARFVPATGSAVSDPDVLAAEQRQVNGCQLALFVRAALNP
jgi:hypothetical protein